jgi:hypothetical protein
MATDLRSLADLRRATPTGARIHIENILHPHLTGPRTILKAQVKAWKMSWPAARPNPHGHTATWLTVPRRQDVAFDGPKVTFLDANGKPWLVLTVSPNDDAAA